jgi:hypothetical protein
VAGNGRADEGLDARPKPARVLRYQQGIVPRLPLVHLHKLPI